MANVYSNYSVNLQDLEKAVIIDDGQGNPVVYVTTTRQVPGSWSVGASDSVLATDVLVNLTAPSHVLFALTGDASDGIVDLVSDINISSAPVSGMFELATVTENVNIVRNGHELGIVFDAVTTSENLGNEGPVNPGLITDSAATSENVTVAEA